MTVTNLADIRNQGIQIEKGIPAPRMRSKNSKYPWHEMEVGDSFLFPASTRFAHEASRIASRRLAPKKFITRYEGDRFRCWRIA